MYDFLIVKGNEAHNIISQDFKKIINIVEKAYIAHYNGNTVNPNTYSLKFPKKPNVRINALPAYIGGNINLAGIKWVSSFPENIKQGIPRASAVLLLNDFDTGYPIACLESSIISAARTAASAVIGAFVLNNHEKHVNQITFIGNGVMAKYIFDFFIGDGWNFDQINLYDTNIIYSQNFMKYIQKRSTIKTVVHKNFGVSCVESDLVVLATTANKPYIYDKNVFKNNALILNISLRDICPEIIYNNINVVDDVQHCLNALTSTHLAYLKYGNHDFISATIGKLLVNKEKIIIKKQQLSIYSPFGMGMLDVAVGAYIYQTIRKADGGVLIKDFFMNTQSDNFD